jgi:DNA-binding transcriptional ArsR family regulator
MQALDRHGDVFAALADPNRRAVLALLAAMGEGTATSIAARMPISRQAVVKHLAQLDRARLVERRRVGREARYSLVPGRLAATAQELEAVAARWDRALACLKRIAEAVEEPGAACGDVPAAGA